LVPSSLASVSLCQHFFSVSRFMLLLQSVLPLVLIYRSSMPCRWWLGSYIPVSQCELLHRNFQLSFLTDLSPVMYANLFGNSMAFQTLYMLQGLYPHPHFFFFVFQISIIWCGRSQTWSICQASASVHLCITDDWIHCWIHLQLHDDEDHCRQQPRCTSWSYRYAYLVW
jgi:hypothetical protein